LLSLGIAAAPNVLAQLGSNAEAPKQSQQVNATNSGEKSRVDKVGKQHGSKESLYLHDDGVGNARNDTGGGSADGG